MEPIVSSDCFAGELEKWRRAKTRGAVSANPTRTPEPMLDLMQRTLLVLFVKDSSARCAWPK
jgi:hypothetical protein